MTLLAPVDLEYLWYELPSVVVDDDWALQACARFGARKLALPNAGSVRVRYVAREGSPHIAIAKGVFGIRPQVLERPWMTKGRRAYVWTDRLDDVFLDSAIPTRDGRRSACQSIGHELDHHRQTLLGREVHSEEECDAFGERLAIEFLAELGL